MVKNLPTNTGDIGEASLIPGVRKIPGGGNGNLLQYSCLGNPMNRGAWQTTGHNLATEQQQFIEEIHSFVL